MDKKYKQLSLFDMNNKKIEVEDMGTLEDVTNNIHFTRTNVD